MNYSETFLCEICRIIHTQNADEDNLTKIILLYHKQLCQLMSISQTSVKCRVLKRQEMFSVCIIIIIAYTS